MELSILVHCARFITYEGLRPDISYSLNVLFETQWMYIDDLDTDILAERNVSFTNKLFPKTIIEVFHERIESVLGSNGDLGALKLEYPIEATCEQPLLAGTTGTPSDCFKSSCKLFLGFFRPIQKYRYRYRLGILNVLWHVNTAVAIYC